MDRKKWDKENQRASVLYMKIIHTLLTIVLYGNDVASLDIRTDVSSIHSSLLK